ncbi:MAG: hypothetical protein AB7F25_07055 [Deferribacterales bacterium]
MRFIRNAFIVLAILFIILQLNTWQKREFMKKWRYYETKDAISEKPIYIASVFSSDYKSELIIRCDKDKKTFDVFIDYGRYLTGLDKIEIRYRFDQDDVINMQWYLSDKSKSIFSPEPYVFAKKLIKHNSFIVENESRGFEREKIIAQFKLKDGHDKIQEVYDKCIRE